MKRLLKSMELPWSPQSVAFLGALLMALAPWQSSKAQTINPALTLDYILAFSRNVENTSAHQRQTSDPVNSFGPLIQAYAWDGSSPGIAVSMQSPAMTAIAPLPQGATDPDIIIYGEIVNNIVPGAVAYVLGGNVVMHRFTYDPYATPPVLALDPTTDTRPDANHPNLDLNPLCSNPHQRVLLVYNDLITLTVDTRIYTTILTGGYAIAPSVPSFTSVGNAANPGQAYTDLINPDALMIDGEPYYVAAGRNTVLAGNYVDIFPINGSSGLNDYFLNPGPLTWPTNLTHPRVDGNVISPGFCANYSVVYEDVATAYQAYGGGGAFTPINITGSSGILPVVGYVGDYNDANWSTNLYGYSSIMGLGAAACIRNPFYKDVHQLTSNNNRVHPSIAGHCGDPQELDYTMIWFDEDADRVMYKWAQAGMFQYKNNGDHQSEEVKDQKKEFLFPTLIEQGTNAVEIPSDITVQVFSLSGDLIAIIGDTGNTSELSSLGSGLYIVHVLEGLEVQGTQKLLVK